MDVETLTKRLATLKAERSTWEPDWQDCADYTLPRKNNISFEVSESRRPVRVYDSTAINALRIFAAGLHSGLSSPSQRWFRVELDDRELMDWEPVKRWMEYPQRLFYKAFQRSNFYQEIHEAYQDIGCFGTPCIYAEEDSETLMRFSTRHIAELYAAQDAQGRIDTLFRVFKFTARQAHDEWGGSCGERILEVFEKDPYQKVEILHAVFPRSDRDPTRTDNGNMPFASYYVDVEGRHIISESGYRVFPFMAGRWNKNSNEVYGRSPAMDALPEIMSLNEMRTSILKSGQKAVDPPIWLPDDGYIGMGTVDLTPGAVNFYRADRGQLVVPNLSGNVQLGQQLLEDARAMVREAFYVNLFLAILQKPNMTATEVEEIGQEKLTLLGPTLGRLLTEIFDPLFRRGWDIMTQHPRLYLPPPPRELSGRELKIEYVSPLALAQKTVEALAIQRSYAFAALVMQFSPEVMDNFDHDFNVRHVCDLNGMPLRGVRSLEEVQKRRQQAAEAQAAAAQMAQAAAAVTGQKPEDVASALGEGVA